MTNIPKISVIIPAYNEIRYIERTLKYFVKEADEIILGDNASTDGTSDICADYAARYKNIKYTRHKENLGASANGKFCFSQATGKYLCITGAHDIFSHGSLRSMLRIIESDPEISMVYPKHIIRYKDDGSVYNSKTVDFFGDELLSPSPYQRLISLITQIEDYFIAHALYRRDMFGTYDKHIIFSNVATDHYVLALAASKGKMVADEKARFLALHAKTRQSTWEGAARRIMKAATGGTCGNPYTWSFTLICEQYDLALEMETWAGAPQHFAETILAVLVSMFGAPEEAVVTREGFPPIRPGKEQIVEDVWTAVQLYRKSGDPTYVLSAMVERGKGRGTPSEEEVKLAHLEKIRALKQKLR